MATADRIKALYRAHFPAFVRFAFRELHPGQALVDTWHIDVVAEYLDRVARGKIKRLIINLPPRTMKSLSTSIALPVWLLGRNPRLKIMSVAGTRELTRDFDQATRELIGSPRCRALFPHLKIGGAKGDIRLPYDGRRMTGVVGGTLVGRGADLIIVDDPIAPAHVHDASRRTTINKWFDAEVIQRLNDKEKGAVIVLMQRLHHDDLSAHLMKGEQEWVHLKLPAVAVADESWPLPGGGRHVRLKGEALAPAIDDRMTLFRRMMDIGAYNFGAQYQQAPFEHMNDLETRGGCFAGPDDHHGLPTKWFGQVSERSIMAYEVFGIGDRHPAERPRQITRDELERVLAVTTDFQNRLMMDPNAMP